jgi:hypothetical protein
MATLQPGALPVLGTIANLILYKRHDFPDKIFVRKKGGVRSETLKKSPRFENARRCSTEFGGRAVASRLIMSSMYELKKLANYNIAGPLNSHMIQLHQLDTVNEWGQRSVLLSKQPQLLEGFNFNKDFTFDSRVKSRINFSIEKENLKASLEIPALIPDINFDQRGNFPLFSLITTLTFIPDVIYKTKEYEGAIGNHYFTNTAYTEWYPVLNGSPAVTLTPYIPAYTPTNDSYVLLLGIGIRFGTIGRDGEIKQLKRTGSAKIIGAV